MNTLLQTLLAAALLFTALTSKSQSADSSYHSTTNTRDTSQKEISVTLKFTFMIEANGDVRDIQLKSSDCNRCSEKLQQSLKRDAVKEIERRYQGKPYLKNGRPERAYFTLPVVFKVEDDSTLSKPDPLK